MIIYAKYNKLKSTILVNVFTSLSLLLTIYNAILSSCSYIKGTITILYCAY